jgi:hypothetical protein
MTWDISNQLVLDETNVFVQRESWASAAPRYILLRDIAMDISIKRAMCISGSDTIIISYRMFTYLHGYLDSASCLSIYSFIPSIHVLKNTYLLQPHKT